MEPSQCLKPQTSTGELFVKSNLESENILRSGYMWKEGHDAAKLWSLRFFVLCKVCVAPRRGTACCFYTLEPSAAVDPRSFHFGASLLEAGAGKWTLQFFKQLPVAARASERARRAFIEERHPLAPAEID